MVGDKWIDAETGLNAGMRAALVQTGKPLDDDLLDRAASLSVEVFTGLEQFVGHLLETIDGEDSRFWSLLKDDLYADCRIFEIRKQSFLRNSDRKQGDFFVLDTNDWVSVLALTSDDHLVMVRQFRYGTKDFRWNTGGSG